jgi:hypothetical protein
MLVLCEIIVIVVSLALFNAASWSRKYGIFDRTSVA